jgi:uncharacterized protein (DUF4213/DUF364 family)
VGEGEEMTLIDELLEAARPGDGAVADVRVGISWTGVLGGRAGRLGLAKTYAVPAHAYVRDFGRLQGKRLMELAEYVRSWNLVEAGIGLAALNAAFEPRGRSGVNALDVIAEEGRGKKVVMVGRFPQTDAIRESAREFYVLELDPCLIDTERGVLPSTVADHVVPGSDIVAITGSAIANKSIEHLLRLSRDAGAYTIVLGPSTPMSDVLFDHGADAVAGVEVKDPAAVLRKISQSGGMINERAYPGEIAFRYWER